MYFGVFGSILLQKTFRKVKWRSSKFLLNICKERLVSLVLISDCINSGKHLFNCAQFLCRRINWYLLRCGGCFWDLSRWWRAGWNEVALLGGWSVVSLSVKHTRLHTFPKSILMTFVNGLYWKGVHGFGVRTQEFFFPTCTCRLWCSVLVGNRKAQAMSKGSHLGSWHTSNSIWV